MKVRITKSHGVFKENETYNVAKVYPEHYTVEHDKGWLDNEIGNKRYWVVDKNKCEIVSRDFDLKQKLEQVEKLLNEIKERL